MWAVDRRYNEFDQLYREVYTVMQKAALQICTVYADFVVIVVVVVLCLSIDKEDDRQRVEVQISGQKYTRRQLQRQLHPQAHERPRRVHQRRRAACKRS